MTAITPNDISDQDVIAAGYNARQEVLDQLRPEGQLYRVRFHHLGDDPRIALRERAEMSEAELVKTLKVLGRLDWAADTLRLVADNPGNVSTNLAADAGVERLSSSSECGASSRSASLKA